MLPDGDARNDKFVMQLGKERLAGFVSAEIESRLLQSLRSLKMQDMQALAAGEEPTEAVLECTGFCGAVAGCAALNGKTFLGHALLDDCKLATAILTQDDMEATQNALRVIAGRVEDAAQRPELGVGGVHVFFVEHAVGQALVDLASSRVEAGDAEAEVQTLCRALEASVAKEQQLAAEIPGVSPKLGAKLVQERLLPVEELIRECARKVAGLKHSKSAGKRAQERYLDILDAQKKGYGEAAWKLLKTELESNLRDHASLGLVDAAASSADSYCIV